MKYIMFSHPTFEPKILAGKKTSTMRPFGNSGNPRYIVGETVSARVWTGKPYRSPQREICHIQITETYDVWFDARIGVFLSKGFQLDMLCLACSEGLTEDELVKWFRSECNGEGMWLWRYRFFASLG